VPKFIEKKYGLEVCTMIYLVEILKEAWNATSFYFFLNPSFVVVLCRAVPSIRHNIISKDQIIVRGSIPEYCGRCKYFREMI
jgi:hypothetical protein